MSNVSTIAQHASRRLLRRRLSQSLPPAITAALLLAALSILITRLTDTSIPLWLQIGIPCLLAISWTAFRVWHNKPSRLHATALLDQRAHLHDQLATSLQFSSQQSNDPFQMLAQRTGESLAQTVPVATLIPTPWPRTTWLIPLALAALLFTLTIVPRGTLPAVRAQGVQDLSADATVRAADNIASAQQALDTLVQDHPETTAANEAASILDELQEQLDQGDPLDESDIARASSALDEAADELDARAQTMQQSFDDLQDSLADLRDQPEPDETSPLRDALARGEYERAAQELDRILDELDSLPEEETLALRESLDQLADDLDAIEPPQADPPSTPQSPQQPSPDESPQQSPPDSDPQQNPDETSDQQQSADPDTDPTEQDQSESQPNTTQDEQRDPDAEQTSQPDTTAQEQSESSEQQTDETQPDDSQPSEQQQDQRQSGEQTDEQSQEQPQQGEQPNNTDQPSQQDTSDQSARDRVEQLRDALKPAQDTDQSDQPEQPEQPEQPQPSPSDQQQLSEQDQPDSTPQNDSSQSDQQEQGQQEGTSDQQQSTPNQQSLERARDLVERWQQDQQQSTDTEQDAEQLRERARELLESLDDEERQALRDRVRDMQEQPDEFPLGPVAGDEQQQATPFERDPATSDTVPVSARQQADASQILAQWLSDRESDDPVTRQAAQIRLREAARSAQQAGDQQPLPPRSRDAVRRYFQRLRELSNQSQEPAPPTADDFQPPAVDN